MLKVYDICYKSVKFNLKKQRYYISFEKLKLYTKNFDILNNNDCKKKLKLKSRLVISLNKKFTIVKQNKSKTIFIM